MADKIFIDRPPRIEPELPSGMYDIPNPPDLESSASALMQQAFLPAVPRSEPETGARSQAESLAGGSCSSWASVRAACWSPALLR